MCNYLALIEANRRDLYQYQQNKLFSVLTTSRRLKSTFKKIQKKLYSQLIH